MATAGKEEKILNEKIAIRIKQLRVEIEPIQSKFAKEHLIDRQMLSRWENTKDDRGITIHSILKFCRMINISLKEFFDDKIFF
ncbi:helix-turn-helix domain-containing protein [Mesoflavibacter zeaxanthinifaciens]|uniref:helix-turn-helix domain-containing protein n=1 Tax=Mesoflavibacter zeaxanthinifaciens TaxID=393060 RepID=UPI003A914228